MMKNSLLCVVMSMCIAVATAAANDGPRQVSGFGNQCDKTWQATQSGNWSDPNNWVQLAVPTAGDRVCIYGSQSINVTVDVAAVASTVTVTQTGSGTTTLSLPSTLTVGGLVELRADTRLNSTGGTLTAGSLDIAAGGSLEGHGTVAADVDNSGAVSADGGTLLLSADYTGGAAAVLEVAGDLATLQLGDATGSDAIDSAGNNLSLTVAVSGSGNTGSFVVDPSATVNTGGGDLQIDAGDDIVVADLDGAVDTAGGRVTITVSEATGHSVTFGSSLVTGGGAIDAHVGTATPSAGDLALRFESVVNLGAGGFNITPTQGFAGLQLDILGSFTAGGDVTWQTGSQTTQTDLVLGTSPISTLSVGGHLQVACVEDIIDSEAVILADEVTLYARDAAAGLGGAFAENGANITDNLNIIVNDPAGLSVGSSAVGGPAVTVGGNLVIDDIGPGAGELDLHGTVNVTGAVTIDEPRSDLMVSVDDMTVGGHVQLNDGTLVLGGTLTLSTSGMSIGALSSIETDDGHGVDGEIVIPSGGLLEIQPLGNAQLAADVNGNGDIRIWQFGKLTVTGGDTVINLSGIPHSETCVDTSTAGELRIDGVLVVQGATIENTNVLVASPSIGNSEIINNTITLYDGIPGFGEFIIDSATTLRCNHITAYGDRYIDLYPNPAVSGPTLEDNEIDVIIEQGGGGDQGELLDLRSANIECDTTGVNPNCDAGHFQVSSGSAGFSDPWAIDELTILAGAKVNLTNRQGFDYTPGDDRPEALFVRRITLWPGAVLNTGYQNIYYQELKDPLGQNIHPGTVQIVNEPLLGFSLIQIDMDSQTEFLVRVATREDDASGSGSIIRLADDPTNPGVGDGVMQMSTGTANSVTAEGAFARAGDETIRVIFKYLFNADPNAQLMIYLSDDPEPDDANRVLVGSVGPADGDHPGGGKYPGAIGATEMAVYEVSVPAPAGLDFHRGTFIELELVGNGAEVFIDEWDPNIYCNFNPCGDVDGQDDFDFVDIVYRFALLGHRVSSGEWCADVGQYSDGFIGIRDVIEFELALDADNQGFDVDAFLCVGSTGATPPPTSSPSASTIPPSGFLIAGRDVNGNNHIYEVSDDLSTSSVGLPNVSGQTAANGGLYQDANDVVHQWHTVAGLVSQDGAVVLDLDAYGDVNVGLGTLANDHPAVLDIEFHPTDPDIVYVTPVAHTPPGVATYQATASFDLSVNPPVLDTVYGIEPSSLPCNNATPPQSGACDLQGIRSVEVDSNGYVYVVSATANNENTWIAVYDSSGILKGQYDLRTLVTVLSPVAMTLSHDENTLFIAEGEQTFSSTTADVYRIDIVRNGIDVTDLTYNSSASDSHIVISNMRVVTDIVEDPDGDLYVFGFVGGTEMEPSTLDMDAVYADPKPGEATDTALDLPGAVAVPMSVIQIPTVTCSSYTDCCDQDNDNIRDHECYWCECHAGECGFTAVDKVDDVGDGTVCVPDGVCDWDDYGMVKKCMRGILLCDEMALDVAGDNGDCMLDGDCDIHDLNNVGDCRVGTINCPCGPGGPGPGPSPEMPPALVGESDLTALASQRDVRPGDRFRVRAFIEAPLTSLRSYQARLRASGGHQGHLRLVEVVVEDRKDHVFRAESKGFDAFAGIDTVFGLNFDEGVRTAARGYLGTFVFEASADAAGSFVIDFDDASGADTRTHIMASSRDRITVNRTRPAVVTVLGAARARAE